MRLAHVDVTERMYKLRLVGREISLPRPLIFPGPITLLSKPEEKKVSKANLPHSPARSFPYFLSTKTKGSGQNFQGSNGLPKFFLGKGPVGRKWEGREGTKGMTNQRRGKEPPQQILFFSTPFPNALVLGLPILARIRVAS